MTRCPAHGNRIQLSASRAVNLIGATPQPDCRWIRHGLLLALQLLFEGFDLALVLGAELLKLLLFGHRQHRLGVGILGRLPPTAHLLREPPLPGKLTPLHLDHFFHQGA